MRITLKAEEHGLDALDPEERSYLAVWQKAAEPLFRGLRDPDFQEGNQIWKDLPPEEREKYQDWTPKQFYAMKLLIDEVNERGMLDI
jgi:hypothetical protein